MVKWGVTGRRGQERGLSVLSCRVNCSQQNWVSLVDSSLFRTMWSLSEMHICCSQRL